MWTYHLLTVDTGEVGRSLLICGPHSVTEENYLKLDTKFGM